MKINDKNLAAFASSTTDIDREGYLMKKGDSSHHHHGGSSSTGGGGGSTGGGSSSNKPFLKRWFVLKGNLLFYFEKKGDKEPLGVVILEGSTVELGESELEQHFCFKVSFPSKCYVLGAESQSAMEGWMKALACASYDYVKLMADELQRQLDELCKTEAEADSNYERERGDNLFQAGAVSIPTPPPRVKMSKCATKSVRKTFAVLHEEFGSNIIKDQKARWGNKIGGGAGANFMEKIKTGIPPPLSVVQNDLMNF